MDSPARRLLIGPGMMKLLALAAVLAATSTACVTDVADDGTEVFAPALSLDDGAAQAAAQDDVAPAAREAVGRTAAVDGTARTATNCPPAPVATLEPAAAPQQTAVDGAANSAATTEGLLAGRAPVAERPGNVCSQLPTEGACALACDPEALIEKFVPAGTCVTFRCELSSGEVLLTGGCHE